MLEKEESKQSFRGARERRKNIIDDDGDDGDEYEAKKKERKEKKIVFSLLSPRDIFFAKLDIFDITAINGRPLPRL